jgi:uncharacterized protein YidB (DUF937 family)
MGLLDQVLGSVLGGSAQGSVTQQHASGMAEALVAMLNDPRTGGIEGLMRPVPAGRPRRPEILVLGRDRPEPGRSPNDLSRVLGQGRMSQISQRANVPPQQAPSLTAQLLPILIDQLTPRGSGPRAERAPAADERSVAKPARQRTGRVASWRTKPDFSGRHERLVVDGADRRGHTLLHGRRGRQPVEDREEAPRRLEPLEGRSTSSTPTR